MKYDEMSKQQRMYVDAIRTHADEVGVDLTTESFTRAELRLVSMKFKGKKWIPNWITHDQSRRAGRGVFLIPEAVTIVDATVDIEDASESELEELVVVGEW